MTVEKNKYKYEDASMELALDSNVLTVVPQVMWKKVFYVEWKTNIYYTVTVRNISASSTPAIE